MGSEAKEVISSFLQRKDGKNAQHDDPNDCEKSLRMEESVCW